MTRNEARKLKLHKYVPDKPCGKGHMMRYAATGICVACNIRMAKASHSRKQLDQAECVRTISFTLPAAHIDALRDYAALLSAQVTIATMRVSVRSGSSSTKAIFDYAEMLKG